jgi:hypothetical protein
MRDRLKAARMAIVMLTITTSAVTHTELKK